MTNSIKLAAPLPLLKDKTVVITGASSGAGRAAAIEFAKHGCKVVLASRNIEALEDVENACREMGALALAVRADVTDPVQTKQLAAIATEFGDGIDIWVNNAGLLAMGKFDTTPIEISDRVIQTNLLGYMHCAHAVLPYFKDQQRGILINNISLSGWFPLPYGAAYSASKFGLRGFSAALRGELVDYPAIYICDLFPAFLDTPGMQHAANLTGRYIQPIPPLIDPQKIAREMTSLALHPRNSVYIGLAASILKFTYLLFPTLSMALTGKIIKSYLKKAPPSKITEGNIFEPASFGTSIHGGWNSDADIEIRKKKIVKSAVLAGFAFGLFLTAKYKMRKAAN